jgi:glycosyltransferase involved in cell wall biosynthesis
MAQSDIRIILIGNYPPDKQESMKLFSDMLYQGFQQAGYRTELWLPIVLFGKFSKNTYAGIGKWLAYLDKWVVYPLYLRTRILLGSYKTDNARFHVCDHSNAPYLAHLPKDITAITCHDVLAIRGALGFKDAYCEASRLGVILQKWILGNLAKARKLATVSMFTMRQLNELLKDSNITHTKDWRVILNAFNEDFYPVQKSVSSEALREMGISGDIPFLLHIGSSLPRKNRKLLVDMLVALGDRWHGIVCFAGQALDEELKMHIAKHGLQARVKEIIRPSHAHLLALYSRCAAFIFPSYSEGFGWPVIEAQACGVPVIASNIEPMPEVSAGSALHAHPDNAVAFADAFLSLSDPLIKNRLLEDGFRNCERFAPSLMINAYLSLHHLN